MATVSVVSADNRIRKISVEAGTSLLKALRASGLYLPAVCGGRGSCGKCRLRVSSGSLPVSAADEACLSRTELAEGWRLACAAFPAGDITVHIPQTGEEEFTVVDSFEEPLFTGPAGDPAAGRCGIAVDIGTTTLGLALIDLRTGKIIGRFSAVNKQREFGGDVISRIERANAGDLAPMSESIRKQIAGGIRTLCAEAEIQNAGLDKIAIAGNTTMLHLLLGLSCQTLGRAPFTPVTVDMVFKRYGELFEGDFDCETVILPGISTYVGADIAAGLLFTGLRRREAPAILMDIGTNGEMALVQDGKIRCTATAAGPAFEGGNIRWGTGSVAGAIAQIRFRDGVFETSTIGGRPPTGICGSGVVDMVYLGLKHGYIEPSGRFSGKVTENEIPLAQTPDGQPIVFCQKDVRELQLAKSAIRSGLDALLNHAGLGYEDIETLYIAGGFGFNLNLESAAGIGLIPAALLPKVSLVGNSALGGAVKYLLNPAHEETLRDIIKNSEEFSLPEDEYFSEHFVTNINFE